MPSHPATTRCPSLPPLFFERKEHIDPEKNPYFAHAEAALFLAFKDGETVGRISAQIDRLRLERHRDDAGQFGFLDAVDDRDIFRELITAAETWLKARGMTRIQGPFSFSINDESGLLVEGFDTPPFVMMGHAHRYFCFAKCSIRLRKNPDNRTGSKRIRRQRSIVCMSKVRCVIE